MTDHTLLPCPFCGGEAEIRTNFLHHFAIAICKECNTVSDYMNSKAEAIAAWNRRTPPAAVPEGWVMVPREPTPEMDTAFLKTLDWMNGPTADQQREAWRQENRRRWALMIAVAPPPPSSDKEEAENA